MLQELESENKLNVTKRKILRSPEKEYLEKNDNLDYWKQHIPKWNKRVEFIGEILENLIYSALQVDEVHFPCSLSWSPRLALPRAPLLVSIPTLQGGCAGWCLAATRGLTATPCPLHYKDMRCTSRLMKSAVLTSGRGNSPTFSIGGDVERSKLYMK